MLKMTGFIILGSLALLLLAGIIFLHTSPVFGGKASKTQKENYARFSGYQQGKFVNQLPTSMDMDVSEYANLTIEYIRGTPNSKPAAALPVEKIDPAEVAQKDTGVTRLRWLGHSALLLETYGKTILLDPMLGPSPSPFPWLGSQRYGELPITADQLPYIDALIISHDHYDHLDYSSIRKLKDKTAHFYVPLGVGAHLSAWGVPTEKIHEMKWGDEIEHEELTFVCTPARHFSGRGLLDRDHTLWASWIIHTPSAKLFFSGDSGYGPHFKEIGEKYGPFDLAMIECGQYDLRWEAIHMLPEQSVQAALDLQAERMMPIHWGAFTLSLHSWTDPIERASREAQRLNVAITTPRLGEAIVLEEGVFPAAAWWKQPASPPRALNQMLKNDPYGIH
ncbi:MAG: MBL fold metallo-hydrolase [Cyclobacteriaceae bacterium]